MNEDQDQFSEQAAAFQKVWMDSMGKLAQAAFTFTPENAPDETIRKIRSGIFQALSHSWEEFMRSPQFLEGMKQWMDNAMNFRKMTNDFLSKARQEMQEPSRDDLDGVLAAVRHLETRILDRMEELAAGVEEMKERLATVEGAKGPPSPSPKSAASTLKRASGKKTPKGPRKRRGK